MFDSNRYVTNGVNSKVPEYLQYLCWYLIETMEISEKDCLQVFELKEKIVDGKPLQLIVHKQEKPPYRKDHEIPTKNVIVSKVYVVDDKTHSTMLLAEEY